MLHYTPQHVSISTLLIIRGTNYITTASGIVTLCKHPYSTRVENGALHPRTVRVFTFFYETLLKFCFLLTCVWEACVKTCLDPLA